LQIRPGGARSWIFRFTLGRRTRDMGLGALANVSLVRARAKAAEARKHRDEGIDPIEQAQAQSAIPKPLKCSDALTFEQAAETYMADKLKRLRSSTHRHQWRGTLETYAYPIIGSKSVAEIETTDVLAVLKPIWETRCETATRLRGRIERILARATVEGHRTGANSSSGPALAWSWRLLWRRIWSRFCRGSRVRRCGRRTVLWRLRLLWRALCVCG
jgi:hypothetical protein